MKQLIPFILYFSATLSPSNNALCSTMLVAHVKVSLKEYMIFSFFGEIKTTLTPASSFELTPSEYIVHNSWETKKSITSCENGEGVLAIGKTMGSYIKAFIFISKKHVSSASTLSSIMWVTLGSLFILIALLST